MAKCSVYLFVIKEKFASSPNKAIYYIHSINEINIDILILHSQQQPNKASISSVVFSQCLSAFHNKYMYRATTTKQSFNKPTIIARNFFTYFTATGIDERVHTKHTFVRSYAAEQTFQIYIYGHNLSVSAKCWIHRGTNSLHCHWLKLCPFHIVHTKCKLFVALPTHTHNDLIWRYSIGNKFSYNHK